MAEMFTANYVTYSALFDPERFGYVALFFAICAAFAYVANIILRKTGMIANSAFGLAILHIFGLTSKKKMVGPNTTGVVTGMTDQATARNYPASFLIGDPVGQFGASDVTSIDSSVPVFISAAGPLNTSTIFWGCGDEGFQEVYAFHGVYSFPILTQGVNQHG